MYVNGLDPKLRTQAMKYVVQDLNDKFDNVMICKNTSKQDTFQYSLLLSTVERPDISKIRNIFNQYGGFDIVIVNDYATFLNFWEYDDAKNAYLYNLEGFVIETGFVIRPNMIQITRMLDRFEEYMADFEEQVRETNFLHEEEVNYFISMYRSSKDFDMIKYTEDKLFAAISEYLMSKFGLVYDAYNFKFGVPGKISTTSQSDIPYRSASQTSESAAMEIDIERKLLEKIARDEDEFQQKYERDAQIEYSKSCVTTTDSSTVRKEQDQCDEVLESQSDEKVEEEGLRSKSDTVDTFCEVQTKTAKSTKSDAVDDITVKEEAVDEVDVLALVTESYIVCEKEAHQEAMKNEDAKEEAVKKEAVKGFMPTSYTGMLDIRISQFEKSVFGNDIAHSDTDRIDFGTRLSILEKRLTLNGEFIDIKGRLIQIQTQIDAVVEYLAIK